jgi:hypothetical protein
MTITDVSVLEARLILEQMARERRTLTYTGFAQRFTTTEIDMMNADHRASIGSLLDAVAEQTEAEDKGILPVLVVKKKNNRPSNGFFKFAKKYGRDTSNPDRLVLDEQARVFNAYEAD